MSFFNNIIGGAQGLLGKINGNSTIGAMGGIGGITQSIFTGAATAQQSVGQGIFNSAINLGSKVPGPIGWAAQGLGLIDGLLGKTMNVDRGEKDELTEQSSGFSGSNALMDDVNTKIDKYNSKGGFGKLFSGGKRKRLRNERRDQEAKQELAGGYLAEGQKQLDLANQSSDLLATNVYNSIMGMSMQPALFKEGGALEISTNNVIVEGALHSQKHKIAEQENGYSKEDFTPKGIPVVTIENGEVTQHAEIERDEIILHKLLTDKLIKLKESKDYLAAGKLLTKELLYNTVDNSNNLLENEDSKDK